MIQVQMRIDYDEETLKCHFAFEILEREDANESERLLANTIQDLLKDFFLVAAKKANAKIEKFEEIKKDDTCE